MITIDDADGTFSVNHRQLQRTKLVYLLIISTKEITGMFVVAFACLFIYLSILLSVCITKKL